MKAELISIGDEILIGQTVNTNATYISQKLTEIGIDVKWITTIGDNEHDLLKCLKLSESRADIIISTGGLGPTHDDMTKSVFVKYFNSKLVMNNDVLYKITKMFIKRKRKMVDTNKEQALVPHNAQIIENEFGTAPALLFNKADKYFFVLPGVPTEMKDIIDKSIIPILQKKSTQCIKYKTLKTIGIPESTLFEKVGTIDKYEKFTKIAFLPKPTGVEIRLTATGTSNDECYKNIEIIELEIRKNIEEYIWGVDSDNMENIVTNLLIQKNKSIAIAEASTGGLICNKLTNTTHKTGFLKHAYISNSIDSINNFLKIPTEISSNFSVKNTEYSIAMATQIRKIFNADYGIATSPFTNISLKATDSFEELIFYAVVSKNNSITGNYFVNQDLKRNKERATQLIINLLRCELLKQI